MKSGTFHLNPGSRLATMKMAVIEHLRLGRLLMRNPNFWVIFSIDLFLLVLALYLSYYLRYESMDFNKGTFAPYAAILPLMLLIKFPVFYLFGLYRGMWRYTSTQDLINIIKAISVSFLLTLVALLYINRLTGLSRSVFVLDSLLTFLFVCGHRVAIRYYYSSFNGNNSNHFSLVGKTTLKRKKRLLLIGAGDAAEKVLRELRSNPNLPYQAMGLVDDLSEKIGMRIHGVPVLGAVAELEDHILRSGAEELLIAIATASREQMNRLIDSCRKTGLPFKAIPSLSEIIDGKVSIKKIREISVKDLLGREEVVLDQSKIGEYLNNKVVLVTGGGGSIGSELCRQIIRFAPTQLLIFDSSEENLHNMEMELLHELQFKNTVPILGRVQDIRLLNLVFQSYRPQVVFHAAAYKHVPMIERNPWEAVYNNIFATQLLIEATIRYLADCFVLVSTDKAVRPTSVMGASKRLTELLMMNYARNKWNGKYCKLWQKVKIKEEVPLYQLTPPRHHTKFRAVRFGNVLGSSGSVVPLFKRQIERGGPVTITHPEITRYFMSIEEAAQLILQAGSMGGDGEIFILRMGDPIKIENMAREMIKLAGREPDNDIKIIYTGLRPGEKKFEELITEGEGIVPTNHPKIMALKNRAYNSFNRDDLIDRFSADAGNHNDEGIKLLLHSIINEYRPANLRNDAKERQH